MSWLTDVRPSPTYLSSLVGPVELVLGLVALYRSPWIRYPGILQGESYIGIRMLADLSVRLRTANSESEDSEHESSSPLSQPLFKRN